MEYEFYCYANHEIFDGYESLEDAKEGIQRLIDTGNFDEDDFDEPVEKKYDI